MAGDPALPGLPVIPAYCRGLVRAYRMTWRTYRTAVRLLTWAAAFLLLPMSFGNPTSYLTVPDQTKAQLQDTFLAAIQQTEAKFAAATNVDSAWTEQQYVLRMASTQNWQVNNSRFGSTNAQEFTAGFRSGFWQTLEAVPIKFDRGDQKLLANVALPTGRVITDMVSGLNRLKDDLFISAATADAMGGVKPYVTPQPFPTDTNTIPVNYVMPGVTLGANSGMTIWKVLEARRRFLSVFVDFDREDMCLAMSSEEETQLLVQASQAPNAPWAQMVMQWFNARLGGNLEAKLCGFRVISSERLHVDGSDIRTCVAFAKRAFCTSPMSGVETKIDILPQERHAVQITGYANWGTFRVFDEMVQKIPCDRSP